MTPTKAFGLDLTFAPEQPPMVNGDRGYSRKGPDARQASYYYSVPQLAVTGAVTRAGKRVRVDHHGSQVGEHRGDRALARGDPAGQSHARRHVPDLASPGRPRPVPARPGPARPGRCRAVVGRDLRLA